MKDWLATFPKAVAKYEAEQESGNSTSSTTTADIPSSSGTDWDALLDDYESVVDSLVTAQKKLKADKNDISALTDVNAANLRDRAFGKPTSDASKDLTVAQMARMAKIAAKALEECNNQRLRLHGVVSWSLLQLFFCRLKLSYRYIIRQVFRGFEKRVRSALDILVLGNILKGQKKNST